MNLSDLISAQAVFGKRVVVYVLLDLADDYYDDPIIGVYATNTAAEEVMSNMCDAYAARQHGPDWSPEYDAAYTQRHTDFSIVEQEIRL